MKRLLVVTLLVSAVVFVVAPSVSLAQQQIPQGYVEFMSGGQYTQVGNTGRVVATNPSVSGGISSCSNLKSEGVAGVVSCIIGFFNYAVYLIMAFSVLYVVYGAWKFMTEGGREEGRNIILYGIIGLFVMVSIWGLVNILDNTFRLSDTNAKNPPQLVAPR
ncbi:MAG: hypothetical protein Q8L64_05530 [bacterium]|nr:hypothetical protein [bacterium]